VPEKEIMKSNCLFTALLAALGVSSAASGATILMNGSFEEYGGSGSSNIGAGLDGWTIGPSHGVDIVFSTGVEPYYWAAANGNVSLSLNYFGATAIRQVIATTPGLPYELSFAMAAEIYGGPATRTMDVLWNGVVVASPSFQYTGQGPLNMGWTTFTYQVLGTGSDTLTFQSTTEGPYGPALDAVSLVVVPEPGIAALGAAAFSVGLMMCRRRGQG
jgi:hypothetical protein